MLSFLAIFPYLKYIYALSFPIFFCILSSDVASFTQQNRFLFNTISKTHSRSGSRSIISIRR